MSIISAGFIYLSIINSKLSRRPAQFTPNRNETFLNDSNFPFMEESRETQFLWRVLRAEP